MGWLWGSDNNDKSNSDPLRDLDPSLRAFLETESPVKYKTSQPPEAPASTTGEASAATERTKPVPTLFPDGRYAHLWKTYTPLAEIEAATKTDQEKLLDVLNGYRERKSQIGVAAITNCALEQWEVNDCFRNGGLSARLTMCRAENKKFERCYMMQSRFLRALGYLSTYDRPADVDEEIQMHADTLFHEMLGREKKVEEAKAQGLPVPKFPPLLKRPSPAYTVPQDELTTSKDEKEVRLPPALEELKPKAQKELRKRLKGLSPDEREMEERSIEMEIQAGRVVHQQMEQVYKETGENRAKRKEQGKSTFGDRISSIFGW